jgi:hypothetical protein
VLRAGVVAQLAWFLRPVHRPRLDLDLLRAARFHFSASEACRFLSWSVVCRSGLGVSSCCYPSAVGARRSVPVACCRGSLFLALVPAARDAIGWVLESTAARDFPVSSVSARSPAPLGWCSFVSLLRLARHRVRSCCLSCCRVCSPIQPSSVEIAKEEICSVFLLSHLF